MTLWLLDTNVLSELRRPKPHEDVLSFVGDQSLETLHVSAVTIAEIRYGIEIHSNPAKKAELELWLEGTIRPMFRDRILPVSEEVMLTWRLLIGKGRRGQAFAQPDLLIAATALHHAMTVVTRDTKGFISTGVVLLNPWARQSPA